MIVYALFMVSVPYSELQLAARNTAMMQVINALVILIFIGLTIFASGAVVGFLFTDLDQPGNINPLTRFIWYPVYLLVLVLSLPKLILVVRAATFSPLIILCVLYCGISMFWSEDPALTLRRSIALLLTTYMGLTFAAYFSWARMVQIIAIAFFLVALFSFFLVITDPGRGIMDSIHPGAWRGPFVEKNQLGGMMTKGLVAAMCAFALKPSRWWLWIPAGLACFALVLLSTSKTSLLVSLLCITLFVFLKVYRTSPFTRIPLLFTLIFSLLTVLLKVFPEAMFGIIGKDPSLTGRTDIWALLGQAIEKKFWLGYGYGVYWDDPLGPSYLVRQVLEWGVPSAHNGWIEIWLSCGIGIVIIFALHCLATLFFCLHSIKNGGREVYWVVLIMISYIGFSMSESAILQQNSLSWIMFVATSAKLFSLERSFRPLRSWEKEAT
jgi:O-antigen ligase